MNYISTEPLLHLKKYFSLFMVTFLWPQTWLLYLASALLGVGAAIIWTGNILIILLDICCYYLLFKSSLRKSRSTCFLYISLKLHLEFFLGQGVYLSRCSDKSSISRNSGVFWAMLQMSLFFGNLFVYFAFQGT